MYCNRYKWPLSYSFDHSVLNVVATIPTEQSGLTDTNFLLKLWGGKKKSGGTGGNLNKVYDDECYANCIYKYILKNLCLEIFIVIYNQILGENHAESYNYVVISLLSFYFHVFLQYVFNIFVFLFTTW